MESHSNSRPGGTKREKNVIIEMFQNYTNRLINVIKNNGEINN